MPSVPIAISLYVICLCCVCSDNGAHNEGGHSYKFFDSSGPLRGFKRSLYEGGIRTPSIVRWKNHIKPGVSDYAWAFWDVRVVALLPLLRALGCRTLHLRDSASKRHGYTSICCAVPHASHSATLMNHDNPQYLC